MLNLKHEKDRLAVETAIQNGVRELIAYLNNGGLQVEGVFSTSGAKLGMFNEFSDFGGSVEISKRLSPIMEKGIAHFTSIELAPMMMRLRQEDGEGYDFVLEFTDGDVIDYIELKITTGPEEKRISSWTLNKNSLVKVPLHLLVAYKTGGSKISQAGVYLCNERSKVVERKATSGKRHAFASLNLQRCAMTSQNFVKLIGDLSRVGKTSKLLDKPYCLMEQF